MLEVARKIAGATNARFVRGDAQVCPLRRESFDVIISSFGVMFFDDPAAAFANIATALRPRGRLAFLCWQDDMQNEFTSIPLRAFGAHTQLPTPAGGDQFYDPQQIRELLSGAGWEKIQIEPVNEPAWMGDDVADVMNYVRDIPVIRSLVAYLGDSLAEQVLDTIEKQYVDCESEDGVVVRAAAWLVRARRA